MRHAERDENVVGNVLFERLAADALDDVTAEANPVVGIAGDHAGREQSSRLVADQELAQGWNLVRGLLAVDEDDVADGFFEAGRVRHEVADGDGTAKGGANLKVEILIDVGIEVELALFLELHDREPGEEFGNGS